MAVAMRLEKVMAPIPEGTTCWAYLDTAGLLFRYRIETEVALHAFIETNPNCFVHKVIAWDGTVKRHRLIGYRLILQQPSEATLRAANRLQIAHKGMLCEAHIAYDFTSSESDHGRLKDILDRGLILKWRRSGITHDEENGWYSHEYSGRKRSGRNTAFYADRHSKITGEVDCCHIELRFRTTGAVRRAGYEKIVELIDLDPRQLFSHNISVVEFTEKKFIAFKRPIIRQNVMEEGNLWSGSRLNAFLDRVHRGRAMTVKNNYSEYVKRLTIIDVARLIPIRLAFAEL